MRAVWTSGLFCLVLWGAAKAQGINDNESPRAVCYLSLDLAFVLDASSTVTDQDWNQVKTFLTEAIDYLKIGKEDTFVSVVTFANDAYFNFKFGDFDSKDPLKTAISSLVQSQGATNTRAGLRVMREQAFGPNNGQRVFAPDVAIIITDGRHTDDYGEPFTQASLAHSQGIKLLTVGFGNNVNVEELRRISSPSSQLNNKNGYFVNPNFDAMKDLLTFAANKSCLPVDDYVTDCKNMVDLTFVIDSSGSIDENNFEKSKEFVQSVVRGLSIQAGLARVALMTYSDSVMPQFGFLEWRSQDEVLKAIDKIKYRHGRTNTGAALEYLHRSLYTGLNGDRPNVPNMAIILTDGGSSDRRRTLEEAYLCKKNSIHLIAVGLGDWTDKFELAGIASYPHARNKIDVADYNALSGIKDRISGLICNKKKECESNPCLNGGQCIDGVDMFWCSCVFPWGGEICNIPCSKRADVIFALDASGSIGQNDFRTQLDFLQSVIVGLNVGQETRVGLLTFGDNPAIRFHLNEYATKLQLLDAMSVHYAGGTTDTAGAIAMMREEMFVVDKGDRNDVSNIGVIFTDGQSNDRAATWEQATLARRAGIQLLAVGVGSGIRAVELEGIASAPVDENVLYVDNFDSLSSIQNTLINATCNGACSGYRCANGGTTVDSLRGCKCVCPKGYRGLTCDKRCTTYVDLALVIDTSGSIRAERFPKVIQFIIEVLSDFALEEDGGQARIGAVSFSDGANLDFTLGQYTSRQDVFRAIKQIKFVGGKTNGAAGLEMVQRQVFNTADDRLDADNIALMFTDGNSNVNEKNTIPNAINARVEGTHIIVFGVGDMINMLEIEGIASLPYSDTVHLVESWTELPDIVEDLKQSTCDDRNECEANPCRNGATCVDRYKRFWCECQPENTGITCERRCSRSMDVVLMLDVSGSTEQVQSIILAFATQVVYGLPLQFDRSRVAVIFYSDDAVVHYYLDSYQSKLGALNAMVLRSAGGKTNTQAAITTAYQSVFVPSRGDRNGAENIGVVVSDGKSNINRGNTLQAALEAKRSGIELYAIAVGDTPDMAEIDGIASDPNSDHVVRLRGVNEVAAAAELLLDRLCR